MTFHVHPVSATQCLIIECLVEWTRLAIFEKKNEHACKFQLVGNYSSVTMKNAGSLLWSHWSVLALHFLAYIVSRKIKRSVKWETGPNTGSILSDNVDTNLPFVLDYNAIISLTTLRLLWVLKQSQISLHLCCVSWSNCENIWQSGQYTSWLCDKHIIW